MATLIRRGVATLSGDSNEVSITYGGFTGTPSVVATVLTDRNGGNVSIYKITSSGATLKAFYNGGLRLNEGSIHWIAVGPTNMSNDCCSVFG